MNNTELITLGVVQEGPKGHGKVVFRFTAPEGSGRFIGEHFTFDLGSERYLTEPNVWPNRLGNNQYCQLNENELEQFGLTNGIKVY